MLLDIRMPAKNGVDVVQEAMSAAPLGLRYPVIAMTGHVDAEAVAEFRY